MKEGWSTRWKALLIWLCGYLSIVAFAVVGGYAIVKSNDEKLKNETKKAFIVTLIFTAITVIFTIFTNIGGFDSGFYASEAYKVYGVLSKIVAIAEAIVFVVFGAIAFFGKNNSQKKAEDTASEDQKNIEAPKEEE